jgi:hydrogenase maturation protease
MKILVAGVGNIFFGDDGFGPAVVRELVRGGIDGATIGDYGIRGLHLAFELTSGYDRAILIDALPRGGTPGTLYLVEPDTRAMSGTPDAHSMDLATVFAYVKTMGEAPPITIVGCEPGDAGEGIELSAAVAHAVPRAAGLVQTLVKQMLGAQSRRGEVVA